MLDNEPNDPNQPADPASPTGEGAAAAPVKKATRKRAAKKAAQVPPADAAVSTQSDAAAADPAPITERSAPVAGQDATPATDGAPAPETALAGEPLAAPAKRAAKRPAKKAAAKRTTKKAAQPQGGVADDQPAAVVADDQPAAAVTDAVVGAVTDGGRPPLAEQPAPVKKAARKRTTKKAPAPQPDLLSPDSPITDGPVAAADVPATEQTTLPASPDTSAPQEPPTQGRAPRRRATRGRAKQDDTARAEAGGDPVLQDPAPQASAPQDSAPQDSGAQDSPAQATAAGPSTGRDSAATESAAPAAADEKPETGQRRTRRRAPVAAPVLFQAPVEVPAQAAATSPVEATPEPAAEPARPAGRRTRRRSAEPEAAVTEAQAPADQPPAEVTADEPSGGGSPRSRRRSRRGRDAEEVAADRAEAVLDEARTSVAQGGSEAPVAEPDDDLDDGEDSAAEETDGDEGDGSRRRRRRRGGRRRRKGGDADDAADESSDDEDDEETPAATADSDETEDEDEAEGSGSSRRRRRRRRRKGEETGAATAPDDPEEIVVRVREPRSKNTANEITAVEGSTRLEAKKQRRRDGRAAGRRRAPIVTEAEFLARRESVDRTMVIRAREDLTQIAVSEDNVLVEHYVAQDEQSSLIGNVYLGRVQNVLPSMEAAFIDIGKGRNAVLYAGEVDWSTLGTGNGPRKIESVLKSGQAILVQVTKDPVGHKGARLTTQISLPGRYVVYVPRGGNGGISRKLPDTERNRLKGILKDIVPDEAGVIVRTAAEGASEEELTRDVSRLQSYWEDIEKKSKSGQAPQLLYGEPDLLIRVVRDLFTEDFAKLVISGDEAYGLVKEYVSYVAPHLADRVEKWTPAADGSNDVFASYRIDEQIKKALDRKVWLPSGGSLIIDRTEAMTVVDVNTGKFTGSGGNLEETVTKNNLEAAEEIVRQLRLRDIGGIIVIDFIDMVLELNRDLVLRRLVECLGRDRTKHQVAEVTSLGLVQMTRKRIGTGLLEAFSENCDHCGGRGLILHDEPKDSRRRSDGDSGRGRGDDTRGRGDDKSGDHGQSGGGDGGKSGKSSRRGRGKGRGRGDSDEQQPEPSNDAARRLAEIAAASAGHADRSTAQPAGDESQGQQSEHPEQSGGAEETDGAEQSGRSGRSGRSEQTDRSEHGNAAEQGSPADRDGGGRPDGSGQADGTAHRIADQNGSDPRETAPDESDQSVAEKSGSSRRRRGGRSRGRGSDQGESQPAAADPAVTPV